MPERPTMRTLSREECDAILRRHQFGRLAFAYHDQVDIQPIHFVMKGDWLAGRTQEGSKLTTLQRRPYVALEVDEVEGPYTWRSVVVQGSVYLIGDEPGREAERAETIAALREILPDAFTEGDRVPHRDVLFRIHIREVTGREAR